MRRRLSTVLVALLAVGVAGPAAADPGDEPDEDLTPPVLRMTPQAGGIDGWYADTATIDVSATDNHANATGVLQVTWSMTGAQTGSGTLPVRSGTGTGTLTVTGGGQTTVDVTASDFNSNETTGRLVVGIDRVAPTVTLPAGLNGAEIVKGTQHPVSYSCADGHSGIASCSGPIPSGGNVDTSTPGTFTFPVTARDKVGRTTTATASYTVVDNVFTWIHPPRIAGNAVVGELLTAVPPTVSPHPTSVTYAWRRNGFLVGTGPTYRVVEADGGTEISVVAAARRDGVTPSDLVSGGRAVPAGTIQLSSEPVIVGEPRVGRTLTVEKGEVNASQPRFTYEWLRDGEVVQDGAYPHYAPTDEDIGHVITARLIVVAPGYTTRTWDVGSGLTVLGRQLRVSGQAAVSGTARVGSVLSAQPPTITFPQIERSADVVTVTYQWLRDGVPVPGATAATYRLGSPDFGRRMSVLVTGSAPGYESERRTSAAGSPVAAAPPLVTGKAKARGKGRVKLTVTVGGVDGVEPTGVVTVRRGSKVVGRGSLSGGALALTLKRQRPGRATYTVTYAGTAGIEAGTVTVKVRVR